MEYKNSFTQRAGIRFPLVMAPMFLVTNQKMLKAAIRSGILGCFPSLNFRKKGELNELLIELNSFCQQHQGGNYGVNLIVQKSNTLMAEHLDVCVRNKVPVYITSLGNPSTTIDAAHSYGAMVLCDVTNLTHAEKCARLGCDGFIAVGQGAGGHAGPFPTNLLVRSLKKHFPDIPVLAAGGIADGPSMLGAIASGASAAYCGTRFIVSSESSVSEEYIQAVIKAEMKDIVMTDRISGTPCTIINTPYAQKIGLRQNRLERFLSTNPRTKKYYKMMVQLRGFRWLEKATKPGNYANLWCAGQTVELIDKKESVEEIVKEMVSEFELTYRELVSQFND
ncbi:MAG: NAD(P)H-dependent flavin oxidoreductase [Bacteroidota bacterium]